MKVKVILIVISALGTIRKGCEGTRGIAGVSTKVFGDKDDMKRWQQIHTKKKKFRQVVQEKITFTILHANVSFNVPLSWPPDHGDVHFELMKKRSNCSINCVRVSLDLKFNFPTCPRPVADSHKNLYLSINRFLHLPWELLSDPLWSVKRFPKKEDCNKFQWELKGSHLVVHSQYQMGKRKVWKLEVEPQPHHDPRETYVVRRPRFRDLENGNLYFEIKSVTTISYRLGCFKT